MIVYVENIKNIKEYNKLTESVGWGTREEYIVEEALLNTLFSISAYDNGEIVGYGRLIGDGVIFLYIQDIMVKPEYQNQKIGTHIMEKLLEEVEKYKLKNPNIRVYVGPDYNKENFYRKFGFKTRKELNLGEGMVLMNKKEVNKDSKLFNWEEEITEEELEEIINILKNDGVIIFPTDTVYGIACNCYSEKAIKRIYDIKKRALYKPISVLTDSYEKIEQIARVTPKEKELIEEYMPGALTIVIDKKEELPDILTSGLPTVGVRIPNNIIALKILSNFPCPLATTSANESGTKEGIDVKDFITYFEDKVDAIIDGGKTELLKPSTIVRVENEEINIIREGSIKIQD